jgi:hypothetical protein
MKQIKTEDFIKFENGEMSREESFKFFQDLIDTGMAWTLQGAYGREAERLIKAGVCKPAEVRGSRSEG